MQPLLILITIFSGIVLALAVIGGTILMGIRIMKGGVSPASRKLRAEEARMIQEIYLGLSRMEERIDALETILLDKKRKDVS